MNTPIIDPSTLTEEQQETIRIYYWDAKDDLKAYNDFCRTVGFARKMLLESIFGEDFFKKGE